MFTEIENQRMESAKKTRVHTNCIGTILYVLGHSDNDTYIGSGEKRWESGIVDKLLGQMVKVDGPQKRSLLVIRGSRVEHMGIVVSENPPLIYHRPSIDRPIEPNAPLEDVVLKYSRYQIREFYKCKDSV